MLARVIVRTGNYVDARIGALVFDDIGLRTRAVAGSHNDRKDAESKKGLHL